MITLFPLLVSLKFPNTAKTTLLFIEKKTLIFYFRFIIRSTQEIQSCYNTPRLIKNYFQSSKFYFLKLKKKIYEKCDFKNIICIEVIIKSEIFDLNSKKK